MTKSEAFASRSNRSGVIGVIGVVVPPPAKFNSVFLVNKLRPASMRFVIEIGEGTPLIVDKFDGD